MCKLPAMRAPLSGWVGAYFLRIVISPGISCSAIAISLRPHDASDASAMTKSSSDFAPDLLFFLTGVLPAKAVIHVSPKGLGIYMETRDDRHDYIIGAKVFARQPNSNAPCIGR